MDKRFNGKRLKEARIYRGMTGEDLAKKVGCKRQTLSMYELGKSQPVDKDTIQKISRVLDFPSKFFYEEDRETTGGTVYFRALLTTNKKYRTEQNVKMNFISQIYSMLQDYIQFPECVMPDFSEDVTPEKAAYALRDAWGLGRSPIDNLITIVERHGILVTSFSTSTNDVDAFSRLIKSDDSSTFVIAYSNNKTSAARIHFDIAHELGHICLHDWNEDIDDLTREEFKQREQEANEFAAAFLLPATSFIRDALAGTQTLGRYQKLKEKWKVSIAAMIRRAEKLGVMDWEKYQFLIRDMQKRGLRKHEPLDDTLMTAGPALLKAAVMMLLQENVFTPEEFMRELSDQYDLSINPTEVEYLLDLPKGTLSTFKIIDFKNLSIK